MLRLRRVTFLQVNKLQSPENKWSSAFIYNQLFQQSLENIVVEIQTDTIHFVKSKKTILQK